jgi:hypothetical protein
MEKVEPLFLYSLEIAFCLFFVHSRHSTVNHGGGSTARRDTATDVGETCFFFVASRREKAKERERDRERESDVVITHTVYARVCVSVFFFHVVETLFSYAAAFVSVVAAHRVLSVSFASVCLLFSRDRRRRCHHSTFFFPPSNYCRAVLLVQSYDDNCTYETYSFTAAPLDSTMVKQKKIYFKK